MGQNFHESLRWFLVILGLAGCCFQVVSCVETKSNLNQQVKLACIEKGGDWIYLPDSNGSYGCKIK